MLLHQPRLEQHLDRRAEVDDRVFGAFVELRDAALQEVEGVAGQRVEDVVVGHDILLSPMRRTLDDVPAGRGHGRRQLVLAHLRFADRESGRRGTCQLYRIAAWRLGHDDALGREPGAHLPHGRGQVAVGGNHQGGVKMIVESIGQQLHGDVDVGHLLLIVHPRRAATVAAPAFLQVVSVVDGERRQGRQRVEVVGLPLHVGDVATVGPDARGEIVDARQRLAGFQQRSRQTVQVEPVVLLPALRLEAEVQVEAVHVGDDAAHAPHIHKARLTGRESGGIMCSTNPAEESILGSTPRKGRFSFRGAECPTVDRTSGPTPPSRRRFPLWAWAAITAMPPARRPWTTTGSSRG